MESAELVAAIGEFAGRAEARHVVVQFDRPVTAEERHHLQEIGLRLLRSVGNHTYFARLSDVGLDAAALRATPSLAAVLGIERAWKLDPRILAGVVPDWAVVGTDPTGDKTVGVYAWFHPDVPLFAEALDTVERHGGEVRDELESINSLVVELPLSNLTALADEDAVQWLEWPLPPMSEVNNGNRAITQADLVQAPPYELDGSGVSVLVYDGGVARASHLDFGGRLTARDTSDLRDHATHVAGTVGGDGTASSGAFKGMAPAVTIESYGFEHAAGGFLLYSNPGDIEDDYDEAINVWGVDISNNSLGSNTATNSFPCEITGNYGATSALIDAIVAGSLGAPFRVVWANGNERQTSRCGDTYYTTAPPAGAKNHIAVGAVNSDDDSMTDFSSWGPVDDGRLRPDLSAPGCQISADNGVTSCSSSGDINYTTKCGTSMAAPTVCGLSALLIEDFRAQFPTLALFRNSTLKAWLAHTTQDRGPTGPDYQFGYGSVRIRNAIDFMRTGAFAEDSVDQGETYLRTVLLDAGHPELKVTLAWDDVPGTPNVDPALVNDLDLRVYGPSGTRYYPWTLDPADPPAPAVQTAEDHLNNIEQVVVEAPEPGLWTMEVHGFEVPSGPQSFSVVGHGAQALGVSISLPQGLPEIFGPGIETELSVQLVATGETLMPGTELMHYRYDGGAYQTAPVQWSGSGDLYQVTLPSAVCGDTPEYYFSVEGSVSGVVSLPADAPTETFTTLIGAFSIVLADDFETDQGWTAV
ncbi:MAG: S8 family serine peptidase, partial [Planctomycetota bacterium]